MLQNFRNDFLYSFIEMQRASLEPLRYGAKFYRDYSKIFFSDYTAGRAFSAGYEMFERATRNYPKPDFGITETIVNNKKVKISEETILDKTFCKLTHFKKEGSDNLPKMLIVSPLAGHYATLLRGTVEGALPHYDVYITEWVNASQIPAKEGTFNFDDFVNYITEFINKLGQGINILAVCQPSVPVLAAVSLMSSEKSKNLPKTLTMMGGPIDTRKSPTEVNDYATEREIKWFENNVITMVPANHPGYGRYVYPGFMQLYGFMAMNMKSHMKSHGELFEDLIEGDDEGVDYHKKFYNEYLAVMDLPAEFYLETVNIVFKKHSLPKGILHCNGKFVDTKAIKDTAILCVEGELDDISGVGQTKAALTICSGLDESKKQYHLQKGAGHYGIFSGGKFRNKVLPVIVDFTDKHNKTKKTSKK